MDFNYCYKLIPDRRRSVYTVTFHESGRIKFSDGLYKALNCKEVDVFLEKDFKCIHIVPEGESVHIRADGSFSAKAFIRERFTDKKLTFPIVYEVSWNEKELFWTGTLNLLDKVRMEKKAVKDKKIKPLSELV